MTEPVRPLEALTSWLDEIQANVQQLDVHQMTGTFDGQEFQYVLVRRAQVHEILNTARAALLQAAAPPAPTAEAVATPEPHGPVSERFMRHHYGASGVTVWPPTDDPATPPERVSEGKAP